MADAVLIDPLGRRIVLHDRTWFGHILESHPEVATYRAWVEAAVAAPFEIRLSLVCASRRVYHGECGRRGRFIRVIADIPVGILLTACIARKIRGGAVEWSR